MSLHEPVNWINCCLLHCFILNLTFCVLMVHVFNLYHPLPITHWQLLVLHLQMDTQSIIYITIYKWIHNHYVCPGYDIKLHPPAALQWCLFRQRLGPLPITVDTLLLCRCLFRQRLGPLPITVVGTSKGMRP